MSRLHNLVVASMLLLPLAVNAATEEKVMPVDPLSASSIANMFLGLGLVLALIFLMAWVVRRMGGMQLSGSQRIRLLGGLSLGPREKVVLIQVENKRLLLGVAQGQVNTLHQLEGDYENIAEQTTGSATDFKAKFVQALNNTIKK
ncbi:MAG: flagellar biosynthetic protein FliO [Gammaproteobacteria bacterium]|nr:flagellar biosynthetic protein FliO [Gammaproteobacteria bacterium]